MSPHPFLYWACPEHGHSKGFSSIQKKIPIGKKLWKTLCISVHHSSWNKTENASGFKWLKISISQYTTRWENSFSLQRHSLPTLWTHAWEGYRERGICPSCMRFIILGKQRQHQNTYKVKTVIFPSPKWNVLLFPLGYYKGKQIHTV